MVRDMLHKVSLSGAAAAVCAGVLLSGCQSNAHPDRQGAVYQALSQNFLASVEVMQDRSSGVMTLRGVVGSQDAKTKAESITKQAAPGYTVSDQLKVQPAGLMGMANPNAPAPQVIESAHPQTVAH